LDFYSKKSFGILLKKWGRAFRTKISQSPFLSDKVTLLRCGRAFRTQIGLHYFFYLGKFGYAKHAPKIGLNEKYGVKNATS
jgi:hypothetical protein